MIAGITESETLTKRISWKCKCKFNSRKYNSNLKRSNNKCQCECKNPKEHYMFEKVIFGILLHVVAKMVNI